MFTVGPVTFVVFVTTDIRTYNLVTFVFASSRRPLRCHSFYSSDNTHPAACRSSDYRPIEVCNTPPRCLSDMISSRRRLVAVDDPTIWSAVVEVRY